MQTAGLSGMLLRGSSSEGTGGGTGCAGWQEKEGTGDGTGCVGWQGKEGTGDGNGMAREGPSQGASTSPLSLLMQSHHGKGARARTHITWTPTSLPESGLLGSSLALAAGALAIWLIRIIPPLQLGSLNLLSHGNTRGLGSAALQELGLRIPNLFWSGRTAAESGAEILETVLLLPPSPLRPSPWALSPQRWQRLGCSTSAFPGRWWGPGRHRQSLAGGSGTCKRLPLYKIVQTRFFFFQFYT